MPDNSGANSGADSGANSGAGIRISAAQIPAMKELCMAADRASVAPAVRELAWELFQELDLVTKKEYEETE